MEITGRITKDATVHKVADGKQVVNFSIAINDSYKPKGSSEYKEIQPLSTALIGSMPKLPNILKKGCLFN